MLTNDDTLETTEPFVGEEFEAKYFRKLELDGSIYFRASPEKVDHLNQEMAAKLKIPLKDKRGRTWPFSKLVHPTKSVRLENYKAPWLYL